MQPPNYIEWRQIKALGVKPAIETVADYTMARERGVAAAKLVAQGFVTGPWLDTSQLKALHWAVYKEIHPWAGELREVELSRERSVFSAPHLVRSDLKTLNITAQGWFASENIVATAEQIAAYNAGFETIHPFLDGNRVVGRLVV
jgi:fido (protein-threonine AMPylation protein)